MCMCCAYQIYIFRQARGGYAYTNILPTHSPYVRPSSISYLLNVQKLQTTIRYSDLWLRGARAGRNIFNTGCNDRNKLFSSIIGTPNHPPPFLFKILTFLSIFCVRCTISNGAGCIGSPILILQYWCRGRGSANISVQVQGASVGQYDALIHLSVKRQSRPDTV